MAFRSTTFTKSSPFGGKTMNRRLLRTLLIGACAAAPLVAAPAHAAPPTSVTRPANDMVLSIGRGQLITLGGTMANVFVANDAVADVEVKSTRQLYVFGKAGGETTVYASNAAGDIVWSANVRVGSNIDSVDQMLKLAMPEAKIGVATMGTNTYLLTGTVASPEDAAEAERLIQAFVGGKDSTVNIVSRLKTATPLQVNLQVRIAEVSRTLAKNLSSNLTTIDGTGGFKFGLGQGRLPATTISTDPRLPLGIGSATSGYRIDPITGLLVLAPGTNVTPATGGLSTIAGMGRFLGLNILGTLDAGENVGLVSTLAQPNLTALSGETADFLAGGEFPIPMSQGLGTTSIEYKRFGVSLSYTPTVLANGRISLRVRPEVSELSSEGAIVLNGFSIPALTVRRTETTIELGSGQSFMIAGLLRNTTQNAIKKLPGAGDLPVLGSLFRSTAFQKGETELVIVVTPYLVNPVDAKDIKLPTDGYSAPNELERLLGNQESGKSIPRPMPSAAPQSTNVPAVGAADIQIPGSVKRGATAEAPKPGFNLK
ncbi:type II and III secretion system protein family protein [Novosphingobium sp. JCM 18896]|uniref:type II and III secretion system protein family protein n=1 Tax=Novosphingobium sp. JCM 18896 TaxID=2989731 RepID=UPI0022224845|nr:type II and III secretion system protein family protein [Novosphingobium sp. JCM 18896]MCW1427767.1 type II and III secretion system protein family protein [Novosphingobium sp. JCM 18896]